MSLRPPNRAKRQKLYSGVVDPQPREELTMKRFGVCLISLVFTVALWTAPASAQDKFMMAYGGGT
jgi:hypothetical protein